jgi:hypothetical protein
MLVSEGDVAVDEIADRLDARPPRWRLFEKIPGYVGQAIRLAVATAEEKYQRLGGQILYRVLGSRRGDHVRQAGVTDHSVR